jgi:hypothetical protein
LNDTSSNNVVIFLKNLLIKSDTSFPDINAGGTPGPGTVNCPVKYKLPTFFCLVLASGTRFATMYLPFRKHFLEL